LAESELSHRECTGAAAEPTFVVTSARSNDLNTDPANTADSDLIIVTDTPDPDSGRQIVVTAAQTALQPSTITARG
jgi:hypothetical protein